jgi:hypothetical protein
MLFFIFAGCGGIHIGRSSLVFLYLICFTLSYCFLFITQSEILDASFVFGMPSIMPVF